MIKKLKTILLILFISSNYVCFGALQEHTSLAKSITSESLEGLRQLLNQNPSQRTLNECLADTICKSKKAYNNDETRLPIKTSLAAIDLLIQNRADINALNCYMWGEKTPLYIAIDLCIHPTIIARLLEHGADPHAITYNGLAGPFDFFTIISRENGYTPLQLVTKKISQCLSDETRNYFAQIKRLFLEYPLLLAQEKQSCNHQLLTQAIALNAATMVQRLLRAGIVPIKSDLELAKTLDHKEIGKMLIFILGLTGYQSGIATTGILTGEHWRNLPTEAVCYIAALACQIID